jgi:hypothetical protein
MIPMLGPGAPGLIGVTTAHVTVFLIAGVGLVVLGLLAVLFVRWRKSRADRAYFDALANDPYVSSDRPEQPAFTLVEETKRDGLATTGFAVPSLQPQESKPTPRRAPVEEASPPASPAKPVAVPDPEPARSASQDADDAMAELDRLLGKSPD